MNGQTGFLELARKKMKERREYRRTTLQIAHGKTLCLIHPVCDCIFIMLRSDGVRLFLNNDKLIELGQKEIVQPDHRRDWEAGSSGALWITRNFHPERSIHHFHPGNTVNGVLDWSSEAGSGQDSNEGRVPGTSKSSKKNGTGYLFADPVWG